MSARAASAVPAGSRSELALCAVLAAVVHLPLLAWGTERLLAEPAAATQRPGNISIDVDISSPQPSAELSPAERPEIKVDEPEPLERPRERLAPPAPPAPQEPLEPSEPEPRPKLEIEAPLTPEEVLKPKPTPEPEPEPSTPSVRTGLTGNRAARIGRHYVVHPDDGTGRPPREGVTRVRVKVLASGRAAEVELVESSGHRDLDRAALRGLRRARFEPATRNGKPVDSVMVQSVRFRKKDKRKRPAAK